jgi:hypothetical protein
MPTNQTGDRPACRRNPMLLPSMLLAASLIACGPKFVVNQEAFHDAEIGAMMLKAQLALELAHLDEGKAPPNNLQVLVMANSTMIDGASSALKLTGKNETERTLINLYLEATQGVNDALRIMKWKQEILQASERTTLLGGTLAVVDLEDVMKRYEIPTSPGRESQRTFVPDEAVRLIWQKTTKTLEKAQELYRQPAR